MAGVQKPRIYNAKKVDNNILSNNKDIAASLSTYFTEIEPTRSNQIPQTNDNVDEFVEQDFGLFKFKNISIDDVRNVIKKLMPQNLTGLIRYLLVSLRIQVI